MSRNTLENISRIFSFGGSKEKYLFCEQDPMAVQKKSPDFVNKIQVEPSHIIVNVPTKVIRC